MDRIFVYPTEQPRDVDILTAERSKMIAQGYLSQGVFGTSAVVDGLACTPTTPLSLAVQIGPGSIYQQFPVDSTIYSSLPLDSVDQIIKQGILLQSASLTLTPPGVSGQAINYLIEAEFSEVDTGNAVLPYFNSTNPNIPFSGPNGSGISQPTIRAGQISLVAKAGTAATAGSQVTPAPDAGFVGLWVVVVANGATQLTSAQISVYPGAPFISVKLPAVPPWVQGGTYEWSADAGTANQLNVTLSPVPTTIAAGFEVFVKKISSANTGAMTIIVNGLGPYPVIHNDGSAMANADATGNYRMHLKFDGTAFCFLNAPVATAVGSLSANAGEGITVSGGATVSLNYPGLSTELSIANSDLFSFYSIADTHHRVETWAQLLANLAIALPIACVGVKFFGTTGTYTPTANAQFVVGFIQGPGGGGRGGGPGHGGGGGAGEFAVFTSTAVTTVVTIGLGGAGGLGTNGYPGSGPSKFGTIATANPGQGGSIETSGTDVISLGGLGGFGGSSNVINVIGNAGHGSYFRAGNGGAGFLGAAGRAGSNVNTPIQGNFGAGGGGAGTLQGARGGDGWCMLLEFS